MSKEKAKIFHLLFDKTHMTCFLSAVLIIVMVTVTYIILINKNQYKFFFLVDVKILRYILYTNHKSNTKSMLNCDDLCANIDLKKRGKSLKKKQLVKYYSQQSFLFRDTVTPLSRWRYFACNAKHAWRGRKGGGIEHPTSHVKLFFF